MQTSKVGHGSAEFNPTRRTLILRLLTQQVGELPTEVRQQVEALEIAQLENLGSALLRFSSFADLVGWLEALPQG